MVLAFAISLINSKLKGKDFLYLFLYPVYSTIHIIKNFPICRFIRNLIHGKGLKQNVEKFTVRVAVTDGKRVLPCYMELQSENGLAKVKFMFKKKKFVTKTHLRMVDAIAEVIKKLSDYGMTLMICQSCAHFTQCIDGSTNMINGFCNLQINKSMTGRFPTLLWNACDGFQSSGVKNIIEEISEQ